MNADFYKRASVLELFADHETSESAGGPAHSKTLTRISPP